MDLYNSLSWGHGTAPGEDSEKLESDFNVRWRCALLYSSLYDEDAARMADVRRRLDSIGVWGQVVEYMHKHGLYESTEKKT